MSKRIKYSEEFSDTLTRFPSYNSYLFYSLLAIIIFSFSLLAIIKSPEIILGEAQVTAVKPPIELVAQNSGKIILKKFRAHEYFKKGDFLAVIENSANEEEVFELKNILTKFQNKLFDLKESDIAFAINYRLGDVQQYYLDLLNVLYSLNRAKNFNEFDAKRVVLNKQIGKYYEIINQRNEIKQIKKYDIQIIRGKMLEDSILFSKGLILKSEYDQSNRNILREEESLKGYESRDLENSLSISDNLQNIKLLHWQKKTEILDLELKLINSFQQLNQAINLWESRYVFKVPIDGEVDMMQFISSYQYIKQGDPVFSILPEDNQVLARLIVPPVGAGKIKIGQEVVVKLASFPYQEFGKLIGKIATISLIPTQNYYLITVELPNGLKSDTQQILTFSKNMIGSAEIITEKRSLLSKLFNRIFSALDPKPKEKPQESSKK